MICERHFNLITKDGLSIPLNETTAIFRNQCSHCDPNEAQDVLFHAEVYDNLLELIRLGNAEKLWISYCVKAKERRIIKIYGAFTFFVKEFNNINLCEQIVVEIKDDGVSFINNSENDIYIKTMMPHHTFVSVKDDDIVHVSKSDFVIIKSSIITDFEIPHKNDNDWIDELDWI